MIAATGDGRAASLAAIQSVMSRVFGVPADSITEATRATSIERWDSLNMVVVAIGLERRLGRAVDAALCNSARSVGELVDILCRSSGS